MEKNILMNKERLAMMLFKEGHIKLKRPGDKHGFKLKLHDEHPDVPDSPYYFNFRDLSDEILSCTGWLFNELVKDREIKFNRIVGLPKAGDPLAKFFAKITGRSNDLIFLKKGELEGRRIILPHIIGKYNKEDIVLIVDDVISKGHTKIEGIKLLKDSDLAVIDCIILVDRQQGGIKLLHELGIEVHFLFTLEEILEIYIRNEFIIEDMRNEILAYPKLAEEYINKN